MSGTVASAFHRAALYRLCSLALGYPVPGRLADVARTGAAAARAAEISLRPLVTEVVAAAEATGDAAAASEYVRLFDGAVACVPYEGAYGPPQMAGKTALLADIGGFYAAFGLEVAGGQPDVEDHIATELEFLSALALKEAWAIAEHHGDHADVSHDAGLAFLRDHLARWAPAFTDALEAAAALDYYRAVARLLRAWVDADVRRLGVTVEPLAPGAAAGAEGGEPFTCPMTGGE
jgi:DMSO reductase family type II enzyme chaperone